MRCGNNLRSSTKAPFLRRSVNRLHSLGYFVSSAVAPKYSGTQTDLLYEAHDYPAHGMN